MPNRQLTFISGSSDFRKLVQKMRKAFHNWGAKRGLNNGIVCSQNKSRERCNSNLSGQRQLNRLLKLGKDKKNKGITGREGSSRK